MKYRIPLYVHPDEIWFGINILPSGEKSVDFSGNLYCFRRVNGKGPWPLEYLSGYFTVKEN